MKPTEIHQTVSRLLESKLKPLITEGAGRELNLMTCVEFYVTIFETLSEVIEAAQLPLTNEGMNYLAQQYYDGIQINGGQELDPDIFTNRASVENMETKELALLATMLLGTDFALPLLAEIKRRS